MHKRVVGPILFVSLALFAGQQKHETKVDSMVYDSGSEWKIFSTQGPVKGFSVMRDGLWYFTDQGIFYLPTASMKKAELPSYKDIGGIPAADVTTIAVDFSGVLWVGTKAGLAMKTKESFKIFTKDNGLPDNMINKLLPLKAGKLWVATDNGAALHQNGTWTVYTAKEGLAGDKVHDIVMGEDNEIWFGTNKGISCFDGTKWTTHTMKTGMSWNDTKAISYDGRKNTIWAAAGEKDMNAYNGKSWKVFMDVADGIVNIMVDTQSRVWIATAAGLQKFNGEEWITDPQKIGITASQVSQMFRDDKGNLWFGMESGVLKLNNPYPY
jgi:ligand-binding sensor domain-containing protein